MFGLGWQEFLILLILALPIIGVIVVVKRGKIIPLAAGVGFLQGLANIGFALFSDPLGLLPQDQSEAAIGMALMVVQGVAMIAAAVATYRNKLWGAYLLLIMAVISDVNFVLAGARSGWLIPILVTLLYAMAVRSLRRTSEAPKAPLLNCPQCSAPYYATDYRRDLTTIYCSACKAPLPRPT
jgi:hypothetical protein